MTDEIRLLTITRTLGGGGGVESLLQDLLPSFANQGCKVTTAYSDIGQGTTEEKVRKHFEKGKVKLVKIPRFKTPGMSIASFRIAGGKALQKLDVDIVHSHSLPGPGVLGRAVSRSSKIPHVVTLHGEEISRLSKRPGFRQVNGTVLSDADLIIAVSDELAGMAERIFDIEVKVITNGVDTDRFTPSDEVERTYHCGFVGMFRPEKGPIQALETFAKIKEQVGDDAQFVMVGDGPLWTEVIETRARLGLEDNVKLTKLLKGKALVRSYQSCRSIILPSEREGLGIVALESLACGTPVAAFSVGGLKSILDDGVGGILVEPADINALADEAVELMGKGYLTRSGSNGRQKICDKFSLEKTTYDHIKAYKSLLG